MSILNILILVIIAAIVLIVLFAIFHVFVLMIPAIIVVALVIWAINHFSKNKENDLSSSSNDKTSWDQFFNISENEQPKRKKARNVTIKDVDDDKKKDK